MYILPSLFKKQGGINAPEQMKVTLVTLLEKLLHLLVVAEDIKFCKAAMAAKLLTMMMRYSIHILAKVQEFCRQKQKPAQLLRTAFLLKISSEESNFIPAVVVPRF